MALAYLKLESNENSVVRFKADIGTNRWFRYIIGKKKDHQNGIDIIDEVIHESKLFEQSNENPFNSSFNLEIADDLFRDGRKYVQLLSYKDNRGTSPAVSSAVLVFKTVGIGELPTLELSLSQPENKTMQTQSFNSCRNVSFSFQESKFSDAMFLDALLNVVKLLAPTAVNAIGSAAGINPSSNTQILQVVNGVIDAIKNATPAATPAANPAPVPAPAQQVAEAHALSYAKTSRTAKFINKNKPISKGMIIDGGVITGPLLASLAGPVLQQAPQILQTLLGKPIELMNAIMNFNLQKRQNEQNFMTNLINSVNQDTLLSEMIRNGMMPANLGIAQSVSHQITPPNVSLKIDIGTPMEVFGKPKYVYATTKGIRFTLSTNFTEKIPTAPLPKAIVKVCFKDATNSKKYFEKHFKLKDILPNTPFQVDFFPDELNALPAQTDILMDVQFLWKSEKTGKVFSLTAHHVVFFVQQYILLDFGDTISEELSLKDMERFRPFWHKVWEGATSNKVKWDIEATFRYYTFYRPLADSNGRIETKISKTENEEQASDLRLEIRGSMKSGLEISPVELNKLSPLFGKYPSLPMEKLAAFKTSDLSAYFNLQATQSIQMKGKKEEIGALWVYPEVTLKGATLGKIEKTNENGQVIEHSKENAYLPAVTSVHFVGLKTQ
ncbi:MAG: hypothetical protein K1X55_03275 [Chitinophagales bacterium]|nr:hypothetical protein [Chitinophagales bacterium]